MNIKIHSEIKYPSDYIKLKPIKRYTAKRSVTEVLGRIYEEIRLMQKVSKMHDINLYSDRIDTNGKYLDNGYKQTSPGVLLTWKDRYNTCHLFFSDGYSTVTSNLEAIADSIHFCRMRLQLPVIAK